MIFILKKIFLFILFVNLFNCLPFKEKKNISYSNHIFIQKNPNRNSLKKIPAFLIPEDSKMIYLIQLKGELGFFDMKESLIFFSNIFSLEKNEEFYKNILKQQSWKILQKEKRKNQIFYVIENSYKRNLIILLQRKKNLTKIKILYKQKIY